jgi:hypothetical protein
MHVALDSFKDLVGDLNTDISSNSLQLKMFVGGFSIIQTDDITDKKKNHLLTMRQEENQKLCQKNEETKY